MILHKLIIYIRCTLLLFIIIRVYYLSTQGLINYSIGARLKKTWKVYHRYNYCTVHTWNKLGIRPPLG